MVQVVVGIGSNVDRESNISQSLNELSETFGTLKISPVYESLPSEKKIQNSVRAEISSYYNLVVAFDTIFSALEIRNILKTIETKQNRIRNSDLVTLDLDLLLYGDWLGELVGNTIPHEEIQQCAYVLRPLSDLLPDTKHPETADKFSDMWLRFENKEQALPVDFVWNGRVISQSLPVNIL